MRDENPQLDLFNFEQIKQHHLFSDIQPHIVESGWGFHKENPAVFGLFKSFCTDLRNAGRKRYGAGAVFERIRWHFAIQTKGDDFKLNNNYRAFYSRLLMIEDPSFAEFFATRSTKGVA